MTSYSLYIPRIFNNIPDKKITSTFQNLNLGKIKNIDIIRKIGRDGSTVKMAFVHFESWNYYNSAAVNLRIQIEDPNTDAKLVYDDPWYWILLPNTSNVTTGSNNTVYTYTQESTSLTTKLNEPTNTWIEERLTNLENELHYVYEELYQREYIPTKYRKNSTWDDEIESKKNSSVMPMTIDELNCDLSRMTIDELNCGPGRMTIDELNCGPGRMTIDELNLGSRCSSEKGMNTCEELHKTPNIISNYISSCSNNNDDDISLMSDTIVGDCDNPEYDCSFDYDDNTSNSYSYTVNQNDKLWVTANYCGND